MILAIFGCRVIWKKCMFLARNVNRNTFNGESVLKYCISQSDNKDSSFSQSLCYISQIRIEICKTVSGFLKTIRTNSKTPCISCKSQSLAQNP